MTKKKIKNLFSGINAADVPLDKLQPKVVSQDPRAAFEVVSTQQNPQVQDAYTLSTLVFGNGHVTGTISTAIGRVSLSGMLRNYSLSVAFWNGTVSTNNQFRLRIERGGSTVFVSSVFLSTVPDHAELTEAGNIVLVSGDIVYLESISQDTTCDFRYFGSVVIEPFATGNKV